MGKPIEKADRFEIGLFVFLPPHSHPHEQISYVVSGEVNLFIKDKTIRLEPGDMFAVPPNVPHGIQLLSEKARLVDTFCPIREDFLKK